MKPYLLPLLALLVAGCSHRQTLESTSKDVEKVDSVIIINFRYNQIVDNYEVYGTWCPFGSNSETGNVNMKFRDVRSGKVYEYINEKYTNFEICNIVFSEGFKGHTDGAVYNFDYRINGVDWAHNHQLPYYTPFMFFDVDFDGQKELLINNCDQFNGGNTFSAYKIKDNKIELMDYVPFTDIDNNTFFDERGKRIIIYGYDVAESYYIVFSKCHTIIDKKVIPFRFDHGWEYGAWIIQAYYEQDETDFRLDSVSIHINDDSDSWIVYKNSNGILQISSFQTNNKNYERALLAE